MGTHLLILCSQLNYQYLFSSLLD